VIDPTLDLVVRLSLALLFSTAAFHKLRDFDSFGMILRDYRLLPQSVIRIAAVAFVVVETLLAVMLTVGAFRTAVAMSVLGLFACYTTAISVNLVRGRRDIGCGCSGAMHKQLITWWLVFRNLLLMVAGAALAFPVRPRPWQAFDVWTVMAGVLATSYVYAASNRLISEWPAHLRIRSRRAAYTAGTIT